MSNFNNINDMLKSLEIDYYNNVDKKENMNDNFYKDNIEIRNNMDKLIQEQNKINDKLSNFYFDNESYNPRSATDNFQGKYDYLIPENSNTKMDKFNLNEEPKIEINTRLQKLNENYMSDLGGNIKSNYSNTYLNQGTLSISEPKINSTKLYNNQIMNQRMSQLSPIGRNIISPVELEIKANLHNLPNSRKKFKNNYHEKIKELSPLSKVSNTSKNFYNNLNGINEKPIDSRNTD